MALALTFVLVPAAGLGHAILLNQPDHTATAIPVLVGCLELDRYSRRVGTASRWLPVGVGAVLVWGSYRIRWPR